MEVFNIKLYYDSTCETPRTCIVVTGAVQEKMLVQLTSRDVTAVRITISVGGVNRDVAMGSVLSSVRCPRTCAIKRTGKSCSVLRNTETSAHSGM